MHPTICKIGPVSIHSYGVMVALSAVICSVLMAREAKRLSIRAQEIYDLVFWVLLSGIVGARIFYIFLNFKFFLANPGEVLMIQRGGLAWQGSVVMGFLAVVFFIKRAGWRLPVILDFLGPYLALGHAIGRIGCFFNGCCYGKEFHWGIYFPVHQARLHPTQLYEMILLIVLFFVLKRIQKPLEKIPGQVFALYLMTASAVRFGVQFFRADYEPFFFGLGIFQYMSLFFFAAGLGWLVYMRRKHA